MFLGHVCGSNLRRVIALNPEDDLLIASGVRVHRRQAWLPLSASALGILLVILFLFFSRGMIEKQTHTRVASITAQENQIEERFAKAQADQNPDAIEETQSQLEETRSLLKELQKRDDYASGISAMNWPILLLNLTLAISAIAASYLHDEHRIVDIRLADPRLAQLKQRLAMLRDTHRSQAPTLRTLEPLVQSHISSAKYLAQSAPLREWRSKAKRLEDIVPLFRTENARQRGIDVHNILAFQQQWPLELPAVDEDEQCPNVDVLLLHDNEFTEVRTQAEVFRSSIPASHMMGETA
jgi:hypothetical protein